jgi:hypothetical protein
MARVPRWAGAIGLAATGCLSTPPLENPALLRPADVENPVLVAPGEPTAATYAEVYERVIDVLDDYFVIKPTSRYAGHIETEPRIAPGYEQPWKAGSPDPRDRLIATVQTMRHTAYVDIWAGERGGYRVNVEVVKELEDNPRPSRAVEGNALFREAPTAERSSEVVGRQTSPSRAWIPKGRDYGFEQVILQKLRDRGCFK